jgi:hypothetical protein
MGDILKDRKKDDAIRVRLPAELAELARKKAAKEKRPISAVVRDLLIRWLQEK